MWNAGTTVTLFLTKGKRHVFLFPILPASSLKNKGLRIKYFKKDYSGWELKQAWWHILNPQTSIIPQGRKRNAPGTHAVAGNNFSPSVSSYEVHIGASPGVLHKDPFSTPEEKWTDTMLPESWWVFFFFWQKLRFYFHFHPSVKLTLNIPH